MLVEIKTSTVTLTGTVHFRGPVTFEKGFSLKDGKLVIYGDFGEQFPEEEDE